MLLLLSFNELQWGQFFEFEQHIRTRILSPYEYVVSSCGFHLDEMMANTFVQ